jgi:hypothetical protein
MYLAMQDEDDQKFQLWWTEFKELAVKKCGFTPEAAETLDVKAYKECYYDVPNNRRPTPYFSPWDALCEDMSYGDPCPEPAGSDEE